MNELIFFFNNVLIAGVVLGSIYALGAIGITLIFGILRFAHFAHGDMMTLGGFIALLLMLDEPSAGLSPKYVLEIFEHIVTVNKAGVGILMVEQNARQALAFASRGFVLASGQNRFTGTGPELIADPEVAKSFLGG